MNRLRLFDQSITTDERTTSNGLRPSTSSSLSGQQHHLPRTALEERQAVLSHLVRMTARGVSTGLFVSGTGGSGKSRTIDRVLRDEGITPILINSHITPLSLYRTLHDHRYDRVIWLDDCDSIYTNMVVLGLLRSALWGQGMRIVTYSSSQLDGLPPRFEFNGQLIMCANSIPKNEAFRAVLSRVDTFDLSLSTEEAIEQMKLLANAGYRSLPPSTCHKIVDFIAKSVGGRRLSMRIYEPSLRKVEYAVQNGIEWHDLVLSQLDQIGEEQVSVEATSRELDVKIMNQVIAEHPDSVSMQQQRWCEIRQKSRATFFRIKKRVEASTESDK